MIWTRPEHVVYTSDISTTMITWIILFSGKDTSHSIVESEIVMKLCHDMVHLHDVVPIL